MQTQSTEVEASTYLVKKCCKREDRSYGISELKFSKKKKKKSELKEIFANHPDFFLSENHETANKIPIFNFHKKDNNNSPLKSTIEFVNKIQSRCFANNNVFIKFCDTMSMYQNKQLTMDEVDSLLMELFQNDPDLYVDFTRFIPEPSGSGFVPEDVENFVFTSENKGRRRTRRNEESLVMVIWETYKYELDMVYLRIKSTAKKLEGGEHSVKIEQLQSQDFKCIKLLYGRHAGEAVVQLLLSKPDHNAPIIKSRMEKKCEEIERHKISTDRIWGEILEDIREGRKQVRHSCFLEEVRREWVKNSWNKNISRI